MKSKAASNGFALGLLVLFAILAQSFHSLQHNSDLFAQQRIYTHSDHQDDLHGQTHAADPCSVCEFTFSAGTVNTFISLELPTAVPYTTKFVLFDATPVHFFVGSLFRYRGPPSFIV